MLEAGAGDRDLRSSLCNMWNHQTNEAYGSAYGDCNSSHHGTYG